MIEVDDQGRMAMKALRAGVSEARYLDDVWHRRDTAQGIPAPSSQAWPIDKPAEARVNVAKLPVKLRSYT